MIVKSMFPLQTGYHILKLPHLSKTKKNYTKTNRLFNIMIIILRKSSYQNAIGLTCNNSVKQDLNDCVLKELSFMWQAIVKKLFIAE